VSRWHRPGARPVDRAREVARTCWQALSQVDPATAAAIAKAAEQAGEAWLTPQLARHQPDDYIPVPDAAELVGRSVRWTYGWVAAHRDDPAVTERGGRLRVRVGALLESVAKEH
jgi:hypothetical protein